MKKKVVLITGHESGRVVTILKHLLIQNDFEISAVLFDENQTSSKQRQLKRLKAWFRHGGIAYVIWRLFLIIKSRKSTSQQILAGDSLFDLLERNNIPYLKVPTVNSKAAENYLKEWKFDIGLSIGNRIITERIFNTPSLGTINLHHGNIPSFRGGPPCFWELATGQKEVYASVHKIDERIDHGMLLKQGSIPIIKDDTTESLFRKLGDIDKFLVSEVLTDMSLDRVNQIPVDFEGSIVRTIPSYFEVRKAKKMLGKYVDPFGYLNVNE